MSRRANILVVLALAAGLMYGRFFVPWIVEPDPRDIELQQLREENELLHSRLGRLEEENDLQLRIKRELSERELSVSLSMRRARWVSISTEPSRQPGSLTEKYQQLQADFEQDRQSEALSPLGARTVGLTAAPLGQGPFLAAFALIPGGTQSGKVLHWLKNPPAEDIKGSVTALADTDGLITINLGSDSGLGREHTLEVYRLKPSPQYVGMVRILDVQPGEAVGRLIVRRVPVQVGDDVSSELVSKR
jgi:hypothetical protein